MKCNLCAYVVFFLLINLSDYDHRLGLGCPKQDKFITGEHLTLRRHAVSLHLVRC